jgi:putative ABC transport system ATP-binding protein
MKRLRAVNVHRSFSNKYVTTEILKGITIDFPDEKITTVTGPSGSGKSTFLYLLGALDVPTSGEVYIDGECTGKLNTQELSRIRREKIGFVFQFYNLLAGLTVRENVAVPLLLNNKSISKNQKRIDELIHLVGLDQRKDYMINRLSGGEQQRVAIARALIHDPDIIIADEPTGNLDSKRAQEILDIFCDLKKLKKTIVIVTHDENVSKCGDYHVRIKDGRIFEDNG